MVADILFPFFFITILYKTGRLCGSNTLKFANGAALDLPGGFMPGHGLSACWVLLFL